MKRRHKSALRPTRLPEFGYDLFEERRLTAEIMPLRTGNFHARKAPVQFPPPAEILILQQKLFLFRASLHRSVRRLLQPKEAALYGGELYY